MNLNLRMEYLPPGAIPHYRGCGEEIAIYLDSNTGDVLTNPKDFLILPEIEFSGLNPKAVVSIFIEKIGSLVDNIPWDGDEFILFVPHRSMCWCSGGSINSIYYIHASPAIIRPDKNEFFDVHEKGATNFPLPERFNYYNLRDDLIIWDILT